MKILAPLVAILFLASPAGEAAKVETSDTRIHSLIDAGSLQEALALLDRRLKKQPRDASALFLRSTARIMTGEIDAGRLDLEESLEIDPERREGWLNRAALDLADAEYESAVKAFSRAEALDPSASDNSLNIGAALLLGGNREAASKRFRRYLQENDQDPGAFYLVAANYAMAGRAELAVPLLQRAITLDERSRMRARQDANFAALVDHPDFQRLLNTDTYSRPEGALFSTAHFDIPYSGRDSRVLDAALSALQIAGAPISSGVEVTPGWALIWSDMRIKIAADGEGGTDIKLSAPAGTYSAGAWSAKADRLFRQIALQLHVQRPRNAPDLDRPRP